MLSLILESPKIQKQLLTHDIQPVLHSITENLVMIIFQNPRFHTGANKLPKFRINKTESTKT
jgi:hypothetical protein